MTFVFDLDGTLVRSGARHVVLMRQLLFQRGIDLPTTFDREFLAYKAEGHSGRRYLTDVLGLTTTLATDIQNRWISGIEAEELLSLDDLYPDAMPTLEALGTANCFILTARRNEVGAKDEITRLGLDQLVSSSIVVDPLDRMAKANALRRLVGRNPSNCMMVGDTENDLGAAETVSCCAYILNRGFRSKAFWDKRGVKTYSSLTDLARETPK